ncbi:LysM peptidoglycan-binding domain-containing protein [Bacillus atrophaeus]|uniref:LysM peptidoglycan-binding domain-containing protein n=1 Tax=Bacillus atrophaeus TaxID=1452 RepID=UPI00228184F0|nr:LysM peptidoglycan-binding domain-containing protein [Bacillus atrophaeus]MCY8506344.1 LysM peptidoglycan-binding domain-containing protein [Bacillus atrophaeus]MCY8909182.1 LysM peptidoglycan-binding domain-containing protein [Bacillus atrophaeus]MCY8950784.1 LysM peptidoglycan-binding domain-containing protein [Bacillus atrophaeus]MCY8968787.1 LysM peptidoglycan-binding domain-containing protein [Bacillus atrophaeus]MDQ0928016.1 3D (Asp-Asp-Asp) domain-containing protein/LysM repeat prote
MKKTIMSFVAVAAISSTAFGAHASAKEITVQKGDTLWGISQKNGVNLKDLKEWNQLSTDIIIAGEKLTISSEEETTAGQYTVKEGDSLWKIAQKYGISINSLKSWNNLDSDMIYAGTTLAVKGQVSASNTAQESQPQAEPKQEAVQTEQPKQETVQQQPKQETVQQQPKQETVQQQPKQESKAAAETSEKTEEQPVQSNTSNQNAKKELTVTATAYSANDGGISGVTATGVDLNKNPNAKVIAVDPKVIPLGSKVYVEGYGEATAADTGGAIKGNKIDVFVPKTSDAHNWGVRTVKVKVLN